MLRCNFDCLKLFRQTDAQRIYSISYSNTFRTHNRVDGSQHNNCNRIRNIIFNVKIHTSSIIVEWVFFHRRRKWNQIFSLVIVTALQCFVRFVLLFGCCYWIIGATSWRHFGFASEMMYRNSVSETSTNDVVDCSMHSPLTESIYSCRCILRWLCVPACVRSCLLLRSCVLTKSDDTVAFGS